MKAVPKPEKLRAIVVVNFIGLEGPQYGFEIHLQDFKGTELWAIP